jgi:hypothetical protein
MAPELLNPFGFGLKNSNPTKKSDTYMFGVVTYQVGNGFFLSGTATKGSIQVTTGQQPFPGAKDGVIIYKVVTGERPGRPPGPNEWLPDDVWDFISRCWSPSWDGRPDANFAMHALNDAADAVEVSRRKLYTTTKDREKRASRQGSRASQGYSHEQILTVAINRCSPAKSRPIEVLRRRYTDPAGPSASPTSDYVVRLSCVQGYPQGHASCLTHRCLASKNTSLMQFMSINIKSREFPNALAEMLASQEGTNTAMSLQGDDALTLVDVLDQVSRPRIVGIPHLIPAQALESPNVELDLRRKSVHILRRVCSSEKILPRSCILSDNIVKEGSTALAFRWPADVWNGHHNGKLLCIKAFHACTAENLPKIKQVRGQRSCV